MYRWLLSLLVVSGVGALLVFGWLRAVLHEPLAVTTDQYVLDVPPGVSLKWVTGRLAEDGLLAWPGVLELYARRSGLHRQIKAGEYAILPGTNSLQLLEQLVAGRVLLHPVTLVEGWTVAEMMRSLQRNPVLVATLDTADPVELARLLRLAYPHAEGLFLPDTYLVPRGTTDAEVLQRAHAMLQERLSRAWENRPQGLPLDDPYQALILASIIERETALESERMRIAGVFIRRLQRGMRLQTDPTVIYGLGPDHQGLLTRSQLDTDTPYNTYTRGGLPPTPIALPGAASLKAALDPEDGDALFFVATGLGDGSHEFSATLDEHNAAVRRYRQRLRGE